MHAFLRVAGEQLPSRAVMPASSTCGRKRSMWRPVRPMSSVTPRRMLRCTAISEEPAWHPRSSSSPYSFKILVTWSQSARHAGLTHHPGTCASGLLNMGKRTASRMHCGVAHAARDQGKGAEASEGAVEIAFEFESHPRAGRRRPAAGPRPRHALACAACCACGRTRSAAVTQMTNVALTPGSAMSNEPSIKTSFWTSGCSAARRQEAFHGLT